MGLHDRAWSGINLMIFGSTPLLPMKIEQSLGAVSPGNEIRLDSFEEYEDAYDFAKARKNVGFIFLLENCGNLRAADVFAQLSKPFEISGWPCFGVLIHEVGETLAGYRAVRNERRLLSYLAVSELLEKGRSAITMDALWGQFKRAFEEAIIPPPLQRSLISCAGAQTGEISIQFLSRITEMLCANLNISWIEAVGLRWAPIIEPILSSSPTFLKPHESLVGICESITRAKVEGSLYEIAVSSAKLPSRIHAIAAKLESYRKEGSLANELLTLCAQIRPGAPAVLRHVANGRTKILEIAKQLEMNIAEIA